MGSALPNKYFQRRSRELLLRDTWILFQAKVKKKKKTKQRKTNQQKKRLSNKKTHSYNSTVGLCFFSEGF